MTIGLYCLKTGSSVPLKKIEVSVTIGATVGNVESQLLYLNETTQAIEAIFTFPLDVGSAVYKFEAEIEGRLIIAECQEREQARETYDDAIQSGHTAFLLEEHDQTSDVFQCRLGNLPPGGQAKLIMAHVSELPHDVVGRIQFTLPNVLNPRYGVETIPSTAFGNEPVCVNNGQYEMSFVADIQSQCKIQSVVSDSDNIRVEYSNENRRAQVKLADPFKPDHDLSLFVQYEDANQPQAITERGSTESSGLMRTDVLMLSFYPDIADIKGNTTDLGEYIFVIDRSGSMAGSKMDSAKETLLLFLKSLPVGCYFNIISFGNNFQILFNQTHGTTNIACSCEYNEASLQKAIELQQTMKADMGGTEILKPLEEIYKRPTLPGHPRQVILITDGEVWNIQGILQLVGSNAGSTRVFSVGIGEGASTALVKGIARAGKGKYEMVKGTERLQQKVMSILKCAMQPTVTNLKVSWELPPLVAAITVPQNTPNVFSGERLNLYALIQGAEDEDEIRGIVKLEGQIEDKTFEHCLEFSASGHPSMADTSAPIHRLAAKCQIKELEDKQLIEELRCSNLPSTLQNREKQKIILVSTAANIVSKYTSFVGVDKQSKVKVKYEIPKPEPAGMFGSSTTAFPAATALFGSANTNLFSARTQPQRAMFGSSAPGGGGAYFGSKPMGGGGMFGSSAPSGGGMFGSSSGGFPFSMRTNTGFAAATTGFPASGQSPFPSTSAQPYATFGSSGNILGGSTTGFAASTQQPSVAFGSSPDNTSRGSGSIFGSSTNTSQQQSPFTFGSQQGSSQQQSPFTFGSQQGSFSGFGSTGGFGSTQGGFASASGFGGFQSTFGTPQESQQVQPKQPQGMIGLIYLQSFNGNWDLTEDFARVIGISLEILQQSWTGNLLVWATCLAITWLKTYHSAHKEEWEMIELKALNWIQRQKLGAPDLDTIMKAAQDCIQQNSTST